MFKIKKYKDFKPINELTEFNLQRFNSDSAQIAKHVDNPQLSTNSFDKHQSKIRSAMSRISGILQNLKGASSFSRLKSELNIEEQDIENIVIKRILKTNNVHYDVFFTVEIQENIYWGKISNIIGIEPVLECEVFKDTNLYQPKEWVIKLKGLIIKTIKQWLKPETGQYRSLVNNITCYSIKTGKQLKIDKDIIIEVLSSYDNEIIIKYKNNKYRLTGDNFVYFNWWFEKIESNDSDKKK